MNYEVTTETFSGPLELLLELTQRRELSINEVSLGKVTEEYFAFLEKIKSERGMPFHAHIASFLVIAATLMLIKSRSLLKGFAITEEEESDIRELEIRLENYKRIKELALKLGELEKRGSHLFMRLPYVALIPTFLPPNTLNLERMVGLIKEMIAALPQTNELPQKTIVKVVSIEERMKDLESRIKEGVMRTFNEFVGEKKEKVNIIVSFLAMLELIKMGSIVVRQGAPFELIEINHGTH